MTKVALRPLDDTAPCVGCGLCCNGTLYFRAKVTPGEEPLLLDHGLTLTADEDRTYFALPCHHESCGRCTIYEERFDICRSFRCALLRRYQADEVDLATARAMVGKALELLAAVKGGDPAAGLVGERGRIRSELAERLPTLSGEERGKTSRRLLNIIALDTFLDRWFRNKKAQAAEAPEEAPAINDSNS
jgi:Putative zinc- or iron-chelating domain